MNAPRSRQRCATRCPIASRAITIDREERRNALSWAVVRELRDAFARAKADPDVGVVVLTGAGERAFCAGADLTGMSAGAGFTELHDGRGEIAELFRDLYALGKPTIARVRGFALAGGFGLALACDLVVAADDAVFGTPEIELALWPHMITVPLIRSMAPKKALELMLTGRRVDAAEAERIGFVTRVVPVRRARRGRRRARRDPGRPLTDRAAAGPGLVLRGVGPGGRCQPHAAPLAAHDHRVDRRRRGGHRRTGREAPAPLDRSLSPRGQAPGVPSYPHSRA